MKLKICGMKYAENIKEISLLLPDYMGFVFWKKSKRYYDGELPAIPNSTQKVGVFVDAIFEEIIEKIEKYKLDLIQLHGDESVSFCKKLKSKDIKLIKVFSVSDDFNFDELIPFEEVCDYFLFDTKGKFPGGNGTTFNWNILDKYTSQKPLFLSGGIGSDALVRIHQLQFPIYGIDVNSKFEIEPGLKNKKLLKEFKNNL